MDLYSIFSMLYDVKIHCTQNGASEMSPKIKYISSLDFCTIKRDTLPFYQNWRGWGVLFCFFLLKCTL